MSTSKLQNLTKRKCKYIFEPHGFKIIENYRPSWLNVELSILPLELDIFIDGLNIAIEIHGEQHFRYVKFFHKTQENFMRALHLDQQKRDACADAGVILYEITNEDELDVVIGKIAKMISDNPFSLDKPRGYRKRKLKELREGGVIAYIEYQNGDREILRFRKAKEINRFYTPDRNIKTIIIKHSKSPHGEELFFNRLLSSGLPEIVVSFFV